jgi:lipid-binding SYLF domain-containing protein
MTMEINKNLNALLLLSLVFIFLATGFSSAIAQDDQKKEEKKEEKKAKDIKKERKEIQETKQDALKELYKLYPDAKSEIAQSKGYAIFGNTGVNLFVLATSRGGGIAHNNTTGKETYMKMISAGAGLGIGVKKYYAIFIFSSTKAFTSFMEDGWAAESQADAAAKTENQGDAGAAGLSVAPDIMLYQITDVGFAAQATIQGTKYIVDKDLN